MSARFLVDTDVISETARPRPDLAVLRWIASQGSLAIASITLFELSRGIESVPPGKRRDFLDAWLATILDSGVEVVPFDADSARVAARVERDAKRRGRPIATHDLFILASAKVRSLGVATRNVAHFRGHGTSIVDPFTGAHAI